MDEIIEVDWKEIAERIGERADVYLKEIEHNRHQLKLCDERIGELRKHIDELEARALKADQEYILRIGTLSGRVRELEAILRFYAGDVLDGSRTSFLGAKAPAVLKKVIEPPSEDGMRIVFKGAKGI